MTKILTKNDVGLVNGIIADVSKNRDSYPKHNLKVVPLNVLQAVLRDYEDWLMTDASYPDAELEEFRKRFGALL